MGETERRPAPSSARPRAPQEMDALRSARLTRDRDVRADGQLCRSSKAISLTCSTRCWHRSANNFSRHQPEARLSRALPPFACTKDNFPKNSPARRRRHRATFRRSTPPCLKVDVRIMTGSRTFPPSRSPAPYVTLASGSTPSRVPNSTLRPRRCDIIGSPRSSAGVRPSVVTTWARSVGIRRLNSRVLG